MIAEVSARLEDISQSVQAEAVEALVQLAEKDDARGKVIAAVSAHLEDDFSYDSSVRNAAIEVLVQLAERDADVAEQVIAVISARLLTDVSISVQAKARGALVQLAEKDDARGKVIAAVSAHLEDDFSYDSSVRTAAIQVLVQLAQRDADVAEQVIAVISASLSDVSPSVRAKASWALLQLAEKDELETAPPPDKVERDFQGNTWVTLTSPEVERFYNEQTDRDRKKQEVENSRRANGWAPGG